MVLTITNISGSCVTNKRDNNVSYRIIDEIKASVDSVTYGPCEGVFQMNKLQNIPYMKQLKYLVTLGYYPERNSSNLPISIFSNMGNSKKILVIKGLGASHFQGRFFLEDISIQYSKNGDFVGFTIKKDNVFFTYICGQTLHIDPGKCLLRNGASTDGSFASIADINAALEFLSKPSGYSRQ